MHKLFTIFAVLMLVASSPDRTFAAADPYEISAVLSLTGPGAFTSKAIAQSLTLIEQRVNKTGGIQGHPLKITYLDDGTVPQTAVALVNQQVAKGVPLIFGPAFAATCLATMPIVAANGPVSICYSPVVHPHRGDFMFSSGINADDQVRAYLKYFEDRGWMRLAILTSTDATGQLLERAYDGLLAQPEYRTLQVVTREHFNPSEVSVAAQLAHVHAANPDVFVVGVTGAAFGTVLRGISDAGLNVPVASSFGNATYAQMEQYKALLPKTVLFSGMRAMSRQGTGPGPIRDEQKIYFGLFDAAGIRPDAGNVSIWDLSVAAVDALKHLGIHATAGAVRAYIENLHGWVGINDVYDFRDPEHRGTGTSAVVVDRWDPATNSFVAVSRPGGAAVR
ncbi:MAG TPA: ABC transporter substrate-binding protein [Candidatus Binatia bacterium]|nr:ABC transporter substrate-binding protein [Candidatus Binatia bacterium]